jgi:glycosyltransferase involved in cell wall biosynthesis
MLAEQLRGGAVRAVLFTVATHFGFQPLFDLCDRARVPVISYETEYPEWKNWTGVVTGAYFDHLLYLYRTLPRTAGIIGISSFWSTIANRLGIPFVVVPSYLPDEVSTLKERFEPYHRQVSGPFHLVSLGLWVPRECPLVLLRAIKMAYITGIPIRYTAIGRVGSTPMERAAMNMYWRDPILRKIVRISGWVDEDEKHELLGSADAFVLLRRRNRETAALFPTRLPEYLSYARPVIASSSGDLSRYLQHKRSAWLIPGEDDGSHLYEAICELHNNPELAKAIGCGGLAQAIDSFSIEGNGAKMSEFIHAVISGCSR